MTPCMLEVLVALVAHERVPALRGTPVMQDELRAITGRSFGGVSRSLLALEYAGLVDVTKPRPLQTGNGRLPYSYRARPEAFAVVETEACRGLGQSVDALLGRADARAE